MNTIPDTLPIYVYGYFGGGGHRLRCVGGPMPKWSEDALDVVNGCDPYDRIRDPQVEGEFISTGQRPTPGNRRSPVSTLLPPPEGWSYIGWWDRQGDSRYGSFTGVLAEGQWSREQLVDAARRRALAVRVELKGIP